jgi:hypothetical protein
MKGITLLVILANVVANVPANCFGGNADGPVGRKFALLVGVTRYPNLSAELQLEGPANDVALLRRLLLERFQFLQEDIFALTETAGAAGPPDRETIRLQIEELAGKIRAGDHFVLLLSGHGTQVPDQSPASPEDPEADRLDEAFLPRDVKLWRHGASELPGAIRDDDLRAWLAPITEKGALVWLIADCCHSGAVYRASAHEKARKIRPADLGIPFHEKASSVDETGPLSSRTIHDDSHSDHLVAIYACLPYEETLERPMPVDSADARIHGILTYTLCQVLSQAGRPLNYEELAQRIGDEYNRCGRKFPTPLAEGTGKHREVLGAKLLPPPPFRLSRTADGQWIIDGGRLHGLTEGSILAVRAPDSDSQVPMGHVRISRIRTLDADVEACEYGERAKREELPTGGHCEVAHVDYGDMRLKIALANSPGGGEPAGSTNIIAREFDRLRQASGTMARLVEQPQAADWMLICEGDQAYLAPAHSQAPSEERGPGQRFGPFSGVDGATQLARTLNRIARAENLLRLTNSPGIDTRNPRVQVDLEVLKYADESGAGGWPIRRAEQLFPGDVVSFRVSNRTERAGVYATVLFVDGDYGISCAYPDQGEICQILPPGKSFTTNLFRLKGETLGLEHAVAIAVRASGRPIDFSRLEQPSLSMARGAPLRGLVDGLDTPLGKLLQSAMYGNSSGLGTRGLKKIEIDDFDVKRISWRTFPRKSP